VQLTSLCLLRLAGVYVRDSKRLLKHQKLKQELENLTQNYAEVSGWQ